VKSWIGLPPQGWRRPPPSFSSPTDAIPSRVLFPFLGLMRFGRASFLLSCPKSVCLLFLSSGAGSSVLPCQKDIFLFFPPQLPWMVPLFLSDGTFQPPLDVYFPPSPFSFKRGSLFPFPPPEGMSPFFLFFPPPPRTLGLLFFRHSTPRPDPPSSFSNIGFGDLVALPFNEKNRLVFFSFSSFFLKRWHSPLFFSFPFFSYFFPSFLMGASFFFCQAVRDPPFFSLAGCPSPSLDRNRGFSPGG